MSDRHGYDNDRTHSEELYDEYGEWHSRHFAASHSSNGAGAYSQTAGQQPREFRSGYDSSWSPEVFESPWRRNDAQRGDARTTRQNSGYSPDDPYVRADSGRPRQDYEPRARSSRDFDGGYASGRTARGYDSGYGSDQPDSYDARGAAGYVARRNSGEFETRSTTYRESGDRTSRSGSRYAGDRYGEDARPTRSDSARTSSARSASRSSEGAYGSDDGYRTSSRRSPEGGADRSAASRYSRSAYGSGDDGAYDYSANSNRYGSGARGTQGSRGTRGARSYQAASQADEAPDRMGLGRGQDGGSVAAARPSNRGRNIAIVIAVIVAVLLVGVVGAFAYMRSISDNLHEGIDQNLQNVLVETNMSKEPFYMLLLGTDKVWWREGTEDGGVYRSDTMILARVDAPNGTISLVSIPRDTLVNLGQYGWQKINAAYSLGGPSLAVEAVSKLTDVNISHYAEVDIDGLSAVVDAIGGIEVEVPIEIDDEDAGGYVPAGWQTLNGEQTLVLCRSRNSYIETSGAPDLMRAANQRMVLSAIAHKVLASDIGTIAKTVNSISGYVTTDLELNDIIGLAQALQGIDTDDKFYTASLPSHSAYVVNGLGYPDVNSLTPSDTLDPSIEDGWYGILDKEDWEKMKKRMDEGLPPSEGYEIDEATGTVMATAGAGASDIGVKYCWITLMNGTDRSGLATRAMGLLNAVGFENVTIQDAPEGYDYPDTLVIYDEAGRAREAEQIVDALGQGKAMLNDGSWILANDFLVVIGDDWKGSGTSSSTSSGAGSGSAAGSNSGSFA